MQTFLPYPDFQKSAKVLDRQRLGKQRVECLQLLNAIAGMSKGWVNHPCTQMWKNHPEALVAYSLDICREWQLRGYKDTCYEKIRNLAEDQGWDLDQWWSNPDWLGNEKVHASHRSNLLRKLPEYYGEFGWTEPDDLLYVWGE
jgi:hypothetical protein